VQRGYNCLIFEGPGQGQVIREQKIVFRPDWETVVTPVIDFALRLPVVDPQRIALMGRSMGGYLAPRAAAFEHRIKALMADGGVYDFHAVVAGQMSPGIEAMLDSKEGAAIVDKQMTAAMQKSTSIRWSLNNGTWPSAPIPRVISCARPCVFPEGRGRENYLPYLIVDSEADKQMAGQAQKLTMP